MPIMIHKPSILLKKIDCINVYGCHYDLVVERLVHFGSFLNKFGRPRVNIDFTDFEVSYILVLENRTKLLQYFTIY